MVTTFSNYLQKSNKKANEINNLKKAYADYLAYLSSQNEKSTISDILYQLKIINDLVIANSASATINIEQDENYQSSNLKNTISTKFAQTTRKWRSLTKPTLAIMISCFTASVLLAIFAGSLPTMLVFPGYMLSSWLFLSSFMVGHDDIIPETKRPFLALAAGVLSIVGFVGWVTIETMLPHSVFAIPFFVASLVGTLFAPALFASEIQQNARQTNQQLETDLSSELLSIMAPEPVNSPNELKDAIRATVSPYLTTWSTSSLDNNADENDASLYQEIYSNCRRRLGN